MKKNKISNEIMTRFYKGKASGEEIKRNRRLMKVTDGINTRYGMNTVQPASLLVTPEEQEEKNKLRNGLKYEPFLSQTTNLDDIIKVK